MLQSDIKHQLWLTKKSFQRKIGGKEDACVIASDSELDGKIELFKCIKIEANMLCKVVDQYQERICVLAQEENSIGKFLKENGKHSQTTNKIMINIGRAFSYCGQIRFLIRPPLLRLLNEIEVFRQRAISDTQNTISVMEKQRTEYRATLSYMKSVSNLLDPDSNRMLEKFRVSQSRVRKSKDKFDKISLVCLQKVDLLAASFCNMFSHNLIGYMENLIQFNLKYIDTLKMLSSSLFLESYDIDSKNEINAECRNTENLQDILESSDINSSSFHLTTKNLDSHTFREDSMAKMGPGQSKNSEIISNNLLDMSIENLFSEPNVLNLMPTLLQNNEITNELFHITAESDKDGFQQRLRNKNFKDTVVNESDMIPTGKKDSRSWFELFSELDPLVDPDAITKYIGEKNFDFETA